MAGPRMRIFLGFFRHGLNEQQDKAVNSKINENTRRPGNHPDGHMPIWQFMYLIMPFWHIHACNHSAIIVAWRLHISISAVRLTVRRHIRAD